MNGNVAWGTCWRCTVLNHITSLLSSTTDEVAALFSDWYPIKTALMHLIARG